MSSSFGNKNNNNKEEEDTSFYSFLAGIIIIFIIYYLIKIIKKIFYEIPFNNNNKYTNCHCSKCIKRYDEFKSKIKRKNINKKLYINIFLFLLFTYLFISCCKRIKSKDIFDPYEILGISPTDSISNIKKAYKKLSLKYHPDKNKDKSAKDIFMNINKAYKILTDEKAKENYYKYGNPDGPTIFTYGIALPFFLLEGQSGFYILIIFSFLILIFFPIMFIKWFKNRNKYNENGFILDNLPIYYKLINNNISISELPFIIGMSLEFNEINIEYNEEDIKIIFNAFKPHFPKNYKSINISMKNMYAIVVLYIHFSGSEIIIDNNKFMDLYNINKDKIIEKSIFLIDELIKIIFELNRIYEFNKGIKELAEKKEYSNNLNIHNLEDYGIKNFDLDLVLMILKFRANLLHETNIKKNNYELLQFPDNKKNIQTFIDNNYTSINDLIIKYNELEWLKKLDNYKDIKEVLSVMPIYNIDSEITNTSFEEAGNLITFNITIKRNNKFNDDNNNQKQLGFLHSNIYSDNYEEKAYIIIYDNNNKRINYFEKIQFEFTNDKKQIEYNMLSEFNGKNKFTIYIVSISYPGLIINKEMEIDIIEENNLYNNFIKNRVRNVLSVVEFKENYGLLDEVDDDKIHEHIN